MHRARASAKLASTQNRFTAGRAVFVSASQLVAASTQNALHYDEGASGRSLDKETNLHDNGHRTYDSGTGRYTTFDPIGLRGGINGYSYVSGNPLSKIDPNGLEGISFGAGASAFWLAGGASSTVGGVFGNAGSTPNVCFVSTVCTRAGVGVALLGSVQVGYTSGQLCSGQTTSRGVFAQGAFGSGLGGAGSIRGSEGGMTLASGNLGPQMGGGGAAGMEQCTVTLICANDPPCCKQPGGCANSCSPPSGQISNITAP